MLAVTLIASSSSNAADVLLARLQVYHSYWSSLESTGNSLTLLPLMIVDCGVELWKTQVMGPIFDVRSFILAVDNRERAL